MSRKMKERLMGSFVAVVFVLILTICSIIETQYTREATVVSYRANAVVVQDEQGHEWGFIGTGYELGEKLVLVMDNNHTMQVEDDRIIRIK